jgi:hypothetical protein
VEPVGLAGEPVVVLELVHLEHVPELALGQQRLADRAGVGVGHDVVGQAELVGRLGDAAGGGVDGDADEEVGVAGGARPVRVARPLVGGHPHVVGLGGEAPQVAAQRMRADGGE